MVGYKIAIIGSRGYRYVYSGYEIFIKELAGRPISRKYEYSQKFKAISDPQLLFTDYVPDPVELAELYHGCYAYLHGHEFGGTNPSLLMALGCGCAVCALDTLFNREVLKDGEHGLFFLKDENSLKNRIEEMEYHPEELDRLRMKSRARIEANYSWDKILGQYLVLFDKVIKER